MMYLVPPPRLTITGSPRNAGFFRGLVLTFTCTIEIHPSVDIDVTVEARWERNGTQLENSNDGRITVINTGLGGVPYQTQVRFNPTDFEDAGTYNCSARIIPQMPEFILEATGVVTRTITVLSNIIIIICIIYVVALVHLIHIVYNYCCRLPTSVCYCH